MRGADEQLLLKAFDRRPSVRKFACYLWKALASTAQSEYLVTLSVGGPLSSGGRESDDEGLSLVTYWPNK